MRLHMKHMVCFCLGVMFTALMGHSAVAQTAPSPRKLGDLWYEPLKIVSGAKTVDGELGHLMVRENRSKPSSGLVELVFFRLKSTAAKPGYPVVYLEGGPGASAITSAQVPDLMRIFERLREVGDVILLDQRGVGRSRPFLSRASAQSLPSNIFSDKTAAQQEFGKRIKETADHFRAQGIDITAYNTRESAADVDDVRRAIGAAKMNLVGFSYGSHLTFACLRYHSANINRAVVFGSEGPDHTDKLPSTSDKSVRRLAKIAAADKEIGAQVPDLYATLKRVMEKLAKEPAKVTVTDRRGNKTVELTINDFGLQFLIMRDLGDSNDLPLFPAWFVTMDRGDYSILARFAERRFNQFGAGMNLMTVMMDGASGASRSRKKQIEREAKRSVLGDTVNFPSFIIPGVSEGIDLGDEYRGALRTPVPTLFISGDLDNNTPPFQADDIRRTFKESTHLVVANAGHESTLTDGEVQQVMVDYLNGKDVSRVKLALAPIKFVPIPADKRP